MMSTFLRYFFMVGATTTLVLVFCDTQEGQRLLGKAGLFLDAHGVPNDVAEMEKQARNEPAALGHSPLRAADLHQHSALPAAVPPLSAPPCIEHRDVRGQGLTILGCLVPVRHLFAFLHCQMCLQ